MEKSLFAKKDFTQQELPLHLVQLVKLDSTAQEELKLYVLIRPLQIILVFLLANLVLTTTSAPLPQQQDA